MIRQPRRAALLLLALAAFPCRAATITVNDASDSLHRDGCAATGAPPCTLRDAITHANSRPGADQIHFALDGAGVRVLSPGSALPKLTESVTIDGYTQPGSRANALPAGDDAVIAIELNGAGAPADTIGLEIAADRCLVRGLSIVRFPGPALLQLDGTGNTIAGNFIGTEPSGKAGPGSRAAGILVRSSGNRIGGTDPASRNLVSGNGDDGIRIKGAGNVVQGNLVGTDASGHRALGNGGDGIAASGGNTIGGARPGAGNLVSGNGGYGIAAGPSESILGNFVGTDVAGAARIGNGKGGLSGGGRVGGTDGTRPAGPCSGSCNLVSGNRGAGIAPAAGGVLQGNFIGTDVNGAAALGNAGAGVLVNQAARVTIGGSSPSARNLISGNDGPGIELAFNAESVEVRGNFIGTDAAGSAPLPNSGGVRLRDGAHGNQIGGNPVTEKNLIAYNTGAGVGLERTAGVGNSILANAIQDNGALGIDLGMDGPTPNHGPETPDGPNGFQNFPVLTKVTPYSIEGTYDGTPSTRYVIQLFSNAACDPSGYGQGEQMIGRTNVTTDPNGHADFGVSLTALPDRGVAATATDAAGSTSEFSACTLPTVTGEEND